MRNLKKTEIPQVLKDNRHQWLSDYLADMGDQHKKAKYRHGDIKEALKAETSSKCIYCESKIGHNTPGDIEHKVPTSKNRYMHFLWSNLTIACTECNRRKSNHYVLGDHFLDPYTDDVESLLLHHGPFVDWQMGHKRSEATVKTLELNNSKRMGLILRKMAVIEDFNILIERYLAERDRVLKLLFRRQIVEKISIEAEYSAMLLSVFNKKNLW